MNNPIGRYVKGGTTEVLPNRLGWWERTIMPHQDDDIKVIISGNMVANPAEIAYQVYGDPNYAWLVRQYNTVLDEDVDLAAGVTIVLPTQDRIT